MRNIIEAIHRSRPMLTMGNSRRRTPLRFAPSAVVAGHQPRVFVDTAHFRGNYPEQCSLEGCTIDGQPTVEQLTSEENEWTVILPLSELVGNSPNLFEIGKHNRSTHLRFKIYPDGGVARLRVYGEVVPDWNRLTRMASRSICGVETAAWCSHCSDISSPQTQLHSLRSVTHE